MPAAFQVGDWLADPSTGVLSRGDQQVPLRPREMALLTLLANQPNQVITAEELLEQVWAGVVVGTDSVYFTVSQLRKGLGDDKDAPRYIETIPKRGYRLIAPVMPATATTATTPGSPMAGKSRPLYWAAGLALLTILSTFFFYPAPDSSPTISTAGVSIAVMPFVDLSEAQDQSYFADGVAEELRDYLARMPGLQVSSRSPSLLVRDSDLDTRQIGERLGVSKLLEGSIRREGDRVRIAAQLVEASNGFQLWSEVFELPLQNMLVVQDQIGRAIATALQLQLLEFSNPVFRPTDPQAYDQYLLGLQGIRTNSFASLRAAADHFTQAAELDPQFADAFAALAMTRHVLHATGADLSPHALDDARNLAEHALELDPSLARAHLVLGRINDAEGNLQQASLHFRAAVRYAPGSGETMIELAKTLVRLGNRPEAEVLLQRALLSDPLNPKVHSTYGHFQESIGQLDKALAAYQRAIDVNQQDPNLHWFVGRLEHERGNLAQALISLQTAAELDSLDYEIAAHVAVAYANLGIHDAAELWNDRAIQLGPTSLLARAAAASSAQIRGDVQQSQNLAMAALSDETLRDSHNTRQSLRILASRTLLLAGELQRAEAIVLADKKSVKIRSYLAGPAAESFAEFMQLQLDADELLVLAEIYKRQNAGPALQNVLTHLEAANLANTSAYRDIIRPGDLLIEAQLQALQGNLAQALMKLSEAADLGFSSQSELALVAAMYGLENTTEFAAIRERIRRKLSTQQDLARLVLADS